MGRHAEILYRLDDRDEIVFVNDAWSVFANANDGGHLTPSQVLGRSLWDFITDFTTRQLYRDVLKRVRPGAGYRVYLPLRLAFLSATP